MSLGPLLYLADVPGEVIYPKIPHPVTKQPVSTKPANGAFLKHARWKAEQAALADRRASGVPDELVPQEPWTLWRVTKTIIMTIMLAGVLGKFITTSPVWGYERQIGKVWREHIWKVRTTRSPSEGRLVYDGGLPRLVNAASAWSDPSSIFDPSRVRST